MIFQTKIAFAFLMFIFNLSVFGQMQDYDYQRKLIGVSEQWHSIILPDKIYSKTSQNLSDLKIFGITKNGDTLEAPYVLKLNNTKTITKKVEFKIINTAYNDKGYYFTFEIPTSDPINQIELDFDQDNFDWPISLEASLNQKQWFTLLDDYRILSIKKDLTDFQFTTLRFTPSKYQYFRLYIKTKDKPKLIKAQIKKHETTQGIFKNYNAKHINIKELKDTKQTEINVELPIPVRVSQVNIKVLDTFDYYRPVKIKFKADSTKTEKGLYYAYRNLTSGTLNSMEDGDFEFRNKTLQHLKIIIDNQNNSPLKIDTVEVKGNQHELIVRLTDKATYYLTYGHKNAIKPSYDIERFPDRIPDNPSALELGNEKVIAKTEVQKKEPLFKNKLWLWLVMIIIIVLLGWFSLQMIKRS